MDKTIAYWIEKLLGISIGMACAILFLNYWNKCNFISVKDFLDKIITISITLFGFLLTILALIVQSSSNTVTKMKQHGSYIRLIKFNKAVVLLFGIVCMLSLFQTFINPLLIGAKLMSLVKILSLSNLLLFIWAMIDTLIFTLIFYKILLADDEIS